MGATSTNIPRYQPLVVSLAAFAAGIGVDRFFSPRLSWLFVSACGLFAVWILLWMRRHPRFAAWILLLAVGCLGAIWHHCHWNLFESHELGRSVSRKSHPVRVEAIALTESRFIPAPPVDPMSTFQRGDRTEVRLRLTKVRHGDQWQAASGQTRLTVDGHALGITAGDRLEVFAFASRPVALGNPGEFDLRSHRRAQRQLFGLFAPNPDCVQIVQSGSWLNPWRQMSLLRTHYHRMLRHHVRNDRAGLAAAVLIGAREQVDHQRREDFFATGTVHLLAISGLHVGMLAYFFSLVMRIGNVRRHYAIWGMIAFVVAYSFLTDARPPVVRATILIVTMCFGQLLGRPALSFNTLAAAGFVVLFCNPAQLFMPGTQLSFLAVATLMCSAGWLAPKSIEDPLDRLIASTRPWPVAWLRRVTFVISRAVLASAVIWAVALPLVLYYYHLFSPAATILNPLLIIPMGLALFFGFGVLIFGWLVPPVGTLCGWICDKCFYVIESLVQAGRPISGSHYFVPAPDAWWVALTYVGLGLFVALPAWRPPRRWCVAAVLAWIAVGLYSAPAAPFREDPTPDLRCTFLSVGHGTSVVMELPGGEVLLYDAGRLGFPHRATQAVTGYLWSRGITHIDAVILSHADADHYNALPGILGRVSVGTVYVSPVMFDQQQQSAGLQALRQAIEAADVPIEFVSMEDRLRATNDVELKILHPPSSGVLGGDNANSIVLLLDYCDQRVLLAGDLESPGLDDLLAERPIDCRAIMAPHHGAAGSQPGAVLRWSTPEWVVISGGRRDNIGLLTDRFRTSETTVLHTAEDGAVSIQISADRFDVRKWKNRTWQPCEAAGNGSN